MKKTYNLMIDDSHAEKSNSKSAPPPVGAGKNHGSPRRRSPALPPPSHRHQRRNREALQEPIGQIIDAVTRTLERAEPELAADLVESGICLAGGGTPPQRGQSYSPGHRPAVRIADDPPACVARGSVFLENLELWKDTMESDMSD